MSKGFLRPAPGFKRFGLLSIQADGTRLLFGKHEGKTLAEVHAADPGCLPWLRDNFCHQAVRTAAREFLEAHAAPTTEAQR